MESGSLALEDSEPVGRGLQPPLATGGTTRFPSTGGQHQPRPRSANTSPASERGRERQLDLGNLPTEMSVEGVVDGDLSSGGSSAKDPAKPVALPGGVSRNTDCDAVLSTGMRTSSSGPSVALSASRALQHRHQQHEQGSPCRTGGCGTACCPGRGHDHQGTPDAEAPVHIPPLAPRLPAPPSPRASAEEIPLSTLRMTPRLPQSMFAMPSPPPSRGAAPLRLELRPHRPPPSAVDGVWEKIPHDILSRVVAFTDAHGFRKIR